MHAATFQPRLYSHHSAQRTRLSTDGFCDTPATLNLSQELYMGLSHGNATISYRALAELELTTRQAWDQAAHNLIGRASTPEGIRFDIRSAQATTRISAPALEVRVPGAPITAWLAHPRTFHILNQHLELRLGENIFYLAPTTNTLIAIPAGHPRILDFQKWATSVSPRGGEQGIVDKLLVYRHGFPAPFVPARLALSA